MKNNFFPRNDSVIYFSLILICLTFWAVLGLSDSQAQEVVFDQNLEEHSWALGELGYDLPSDWSTYEYLILEYKITSSQRFEFKVHTPDNMVSREIVPFKNAWSRMVIPLHIYKERYTKGHDMASVGKLPRMSGFFETLGENLDPLEQVDTVGVLIRNAFDSPQLSIRSIQVSKEDPGSKIFEPKPLVDKFGQWMPGEWPRKITSLKRLQADWETETEQVDSDLATEKRYDKYGGIVSAKTEATGFFRVEKIDGKWWFVDPDGHLFLSKGVNGIGPNMTTRITGRENIYAALPPDEFIYSRDGHNTASFNGWNLRRRYGDKWKTSWIDATHRRMRAWGFNTIGNWSDDDLANAKRTPYVINITGLGLGSQILGIPNVYAKEYASRVHKAVADALTPHKDDPWMIGYFIGNEPPWVGSELAAASAILAGPDSNMKTKLEAFLAESDTPERRKVFIHNIFKRFVKVVNKAAQKLDPNHLNLGIRFGGKPPGAILEIAGDFDVYSFNQYAYDLSHEYLDELASGTGRPLLIGEFHFGTPTAGMSPGLSPVQNLSERGIAYRNYVEGGFSHPALIGTHWFTWNDQPNTGRMDGENYNIGVVDVTDRPYPQFINATKETSDRLYDVHSGDKPPFYQELKGVVKDGNY